MTSLTPQSDPRISPDAVRLPKTETVDITAWLTPKRGEGGVHAAGKADLPHD